MLLLFYCWAYSLIKSFIHFMEPKLAKDGFWPSHSSASTSQLPHTKPVYSFDLKTIQTSYFNNEISFNGSLNSPLGFCDVFFWFSGWWELRSTKRNVSVQLSEAFMSWKDQLMCEDILSVGASFRCSTDLRKSVERQGCLLLPEFTHLCWAHLLGCSHRCNQFCGIRTQVFQSLDMDWREVTPQECFRSSTTDWDCWGIWLGAGFSPYPVYRQTLLD